MSTGGTGDGILSSSHPSSGFQSAWLGVPGQVSMADIVKMGRPQSKASTMANSSMHSGNHQNVPAPPSAALHHNLQDHGSKVSEMHSDIGVVSSQVDEWPSIEQPSAASLSSVVEASVDSEIYADSSNLSLDRTNQRLKSQLDEVQVAEDGPAETLDQNYIAPASVSGRNIQEDDSAGVSAFDNNLYKDMASYQRHGHAFEHNEGDYDTLTLFLARNFSFCLFRIGNSVFLKDFSTVFIINT